MWALRPPRLPGGASPIPEMPAKSQPLKRSRLPQPGPSSNLQPWARYKEDSLPHRSPAPRPPLRKPAGGDARYRPAGGKIGGLLVERGFARPEDIATALLEQEKGDRRRLHASTRGRAMSAAAR